MVLNHGLEWADPMFFAFFKNTWLRFPMIRPLRPLVRVIESRPLTSEADPSGMYNSIEYLYIGLLKSQSSKVNKSDVSVSFKTFGFFYCIIIVG